jgi:hypothetical protein
MITAVSQATNEVASTVMSNGVSSGTSELWIYFWQQIIQWTIPTIALSITALVFGKALSKGKGGRGRQNGAGSGQSPLAKLLGVNQVSPDSPVKEYLQIERINDKLDSYSYSLARATNGGAKATLLARRTAFQRRFGAEIASLSDSQLDKIEVAEREYAQATAGLSIEADDTLRELRELAATQASRKLKGKADKEEKESNKGEKGEKEEEQEQSAGKSKRPPFSFSFSFGGKTKGLEDKLGKLAVRRASAEAKYAATVSEALGEEGGARFAALVGSAEAPGFGEGWGAAATAARVPAGATGNELNGQVFVFA